MDRISIGYGDRSRSRSAVHAKLLGEEITKKKYNQGGLTLKDLKPDTFESNEKSKLSFRQWSDEFSLWVERIDQDFETLLRLTAQMQEWTKTSLLLRPNEREYRLGAEKKSSSLQTHYFAMKRLTAGVAQRSLVVSTGGMCKAQPPLPVNSKN